MSHNVNAIYGCTVHKIASRWASAFARPMADTRIRRQPGRLPYNAEATRLRQRFGGQAAKMQAMEAYGTLRKVKKLFLKGFRRDKMSELDRESNQGGLRINRSIKAS